MSGMQGMKAVFVGPSLPDAAAFAGPGMRILPPARQGDIMTAIDGGASAIGLIDGEFEHVAPVWHKELLFALSRGLPVLGAASMGALRAVECATYGMIGIGAIHADYHHGRRHDDGDVALAYGPAELGYTAVSIPLVNVDATLDNGHRLGLLTEDMRVRLHDAARQIFFKDRSWKNIVAEAGEDWPTLKPLIRKAWHDQKRMDALELIETLDQLDTAGTRPDWMFNATPLWRRLYS